MLNKTVPETTPNIPTTVEDGKDQNQRYNLSKFEYDLYHEENDVTLPVIRVKRVNLPNNGEKWKIMIDGRVVFAIESGKISKKEREFLQTLEGFNFIISQTKVGIKSLNSFKKELKKILTKALSSSRLTQKQKRAIKNKNTA